MQEVIDISTINLLKEELPPDAFEQLVQLYITDTQKNVRNLDEYLLRNKMDEAKMAAHSIKGSSSNMGATALENKAKMIEDACKENNQHKITHLFDDLKRTATTTMREFEKFLAQSA